MQYLLHSRVLGDDVCSSWLLWIYLVVWIIFDIFRGRDIGGWAKAGWPGITLPE